MKSILALFLFICLVQFNFAQTPLKGKFIEEYNLFLPEGIDTIYLIDQFNFGFGIVFSKSEITLDRLKNNQYEIKELGKSGLIDEKGNWILKQEFDAIYIYDEQFARLKNNNKYRLFDLKNQKYLGNEYDLISKRDEGVFEVEMGNLHGLLNAKGEEFVPIEYNSALSFHNKKFIAARKNGKFGALDLLGKEILPIQYEYISGSEDQMIVKSKDGFELYKTNGEKIIDQKFEHVQSILTENLIIRKDENRMRVFDLDKKEFVSPSFDEIFVMSNDPKGFYRIYHQGKYGILDNQFNLIYEPIYDMISTFSEEMAIIELNGKSGFINEKFELIIPIELESTKSFFDDLAMVKKNGKWGFIDKKGQFLFEINPNTTGFFYDERARVIENNLYGFLDKSGKMVIPIQFDWADIFREKISLTRKGNHLYFIDLNGNKIQ